MSFFRNDKKVEAQVAQEGAEAQVLTKLENDKEFGLSEREMKQKRVAYALNLCMVSLSQIVDYQDINVLQQEYDSILNNLNMEKLEKDDSLLTALKKILDTCHFYLLHAKDRDILKKKQAARLKGALGKALGGGNVMAIFGTPNPWAIGAAVLSMAGAAAVRYKSELDKARLENEVEEWELEKSALEQLHNLRRTLFETTWRLAEKYDFPDRYRLTERQIKIYDDILSDPESMNRYERLSLIKDKFEAYPLFWYYLGRAALETAELYKPVDAKIREMTPGIERIGSGDETIYREYMSRAREAYDEFCNAHAGNEILREDLLSASAYLDYACFFDDPESIMTQVERAHDLAGMDYEIIQMCAFRYLQVHADFMKKGDGSNAKKSYKKAEHCLRFLLNEGFNPDLNGRALSRLYLDHKGEEECRDAYSILKTCIARKKPYVYVWMLPWDEDSLCRDVNAYLGGDDVRRTIFNYQYGRLRLIYSDFFTAVNRVCQENDLTALRQLKEDPELSGVQKPWDDDYDMTFDKYRTWNSEDDPVYALQRQFWPIENAVAKGESKAKGNVMTETRGLMSEVRVSCMKEEFDFISAVKQFIHGTSERKWITLGLYRHDSDYCASAVFDEVEKIELLMTDLVKVVAEIEAKKFLDKYRHVILHDLELPDEAVYDTPLGIQVLEYMENEAERMRRQIVGSVRGGRFVYPTVTFETKGNSKAAIPSGVASLKDAAELCER